MVTDWNYPAAGEFAPNYEKYIQRVPEGNLLEYMDKQILDFTNFINQIPISKLRWPYAENKWTILQIIQHLIDAERIFSYRALRIARNDKTPLAPFEENDYAMMATGENRNAGDLLEEFNAVRRSTMELIKHFNNEEFSRIGTASNNPVSVRALSYIMAGHCDHHKNVIKERYLGMEAGN